jgi:hypothetical protein
MFLILFQQFSFLFRFCLLIQIIIYEYDFFKNLMVFIAVFHISLLTLYYGGIQ